MREAWAEALCGLAAAALYLALGLAFLALAALPSLPGAPAPAPRSPSPAGEWRTGCGWRMEFRPDGSYLCRGLRDRAAWRGTWRLEGGVLTVRETADPPGAPAPGWITWRVRLEPGKLRGRFLPGDWGAGGRFQLTPLVGKIRAAPRDDGPDTRPPP